MKIYKVKADLGYSLLYPEDDVFDSEEFEFKAEPLVDKLPQFKAYFDQEANKPIPDIAYLGMATFAFKKDVAEHMADILETAGEMLPFYVGDVLWYCLNPLVTSNCLDEEQSEYKINQDGVKLQLLNPVFDPEKLPKSSLFKIPNDNFTELYCVDRRDTDDHVLDNFLCAVSGHNFTGVKFEEVFSFST